MRRALLITMLVAAGCSDGIEPRLTAIPDVVVPLERCLADARAGAEPPARLSDTDCFDGLAPLQASAELVPYAVTSPLYSDGTRKARWLGLPAGARVEVGEDGRWDFPDGALLVKHFGYDHTVDDGALEVETRFMIRAGDAWRFYTYRWEGGDARLLDDDENLRVDVEGPDGQTQEVDYLFPSQAGCRACHVGEVIGPSTLQLDVDVRYGDAAPTSQMDALHELGAIDEGSPTGLPAMPSPSDPSAPLEARARAYLHANCSHCHRPGGYPTDAISLDLRWSTPLAETQTHCVPTQYPVVAGDGLRIEPGDPDASVIIQRMEALPGALPSPMPPLGRSIVDHEGVDIVRAWIASMSPGCP